MLMRLDHVSETVCSQHRTITGQFSFNRPQLMQNILIITHFLSNILLDARMSAEIYDLYSNCFQRFPIDRQLHSVT